MAQLMDNKTKIEAEREAQLQRKLEMKSFLSGQLDNHYMKKNQEKQEFQQFREDYLRQIQENNQREMLKEENYRNVAALDFYS